MSCHGCSKQAKFEAKRPDKYGARNWCEKCLADKMGRYALEIIPLRNSGIRKK